MKKRLLILWAMCLMLFFSIEVMASGIETTEENGTEATAQELAHISFVQNGSLNMYDRDYYKFTIPNTTGGILNFKMRTDAEYVAVTVYEDTRGEVWSGACYADETKGVVDENLYVLGGTYYIVVGAANVNMYYSGESYTITTLFERLSLSHYNRDNHKMETALAIKPGTYNEIQEATFKEDYYKVNVDEPGYIQMDLTGYSFGNNKLFGCDFWSEKTRLDFTVSADFTYNEDNTSSFKYNYYVEPGTYYFQIGGEKPSNLELSDWGGPYSFTFDFVEVDEIGYDTNDDPSTAPEVELNTTLEGVITYEDFKDYYKISVPSSGVLELVFDENFEKNSTGNGNSSSTMMALYDANMDSVALCSQDYSGKFYVDKGDYYLFASKYGYYIGGYSMTTKFNSVTDELPEDDDTKETANLVEIGKEYQGIVSETDNYDWIKFVVTEEQELTYTCTYHTLGDSFYLYGYREDGSFMGYEEFSADSYVYDQTGTEELKLGTLKPGTYYVNFYVSYHGYEQEKGGIKYSFKIMPTTVALNKTSYVITQGKTYNLKATVTPSGKTLKWTTSNKNVATVNQNGKVTAKAAGTAKITATIDGTNVKAICTIIIRPKAPASLDANLRVRTGGYDDVKITWSARKGVTGYDVYYKEGTKAYKFLKSYTKTTAYANDLKDGVKYTFKVVSYYKTSSGKKYESPGYITDTVYTLKQVNKPGIKKYAKGKVTLTWKNISGETGYQISRSTKKNTKSVYKTVKSTSAAKLTFATKTGTGYYYCVRAYKVVDGKKVYGPWSNPVYKKI